MTASVKSSEESRLHFDQSSSGSSSRFRWLVALVLVAGGGMVTDSAQAQVPPGDVVFDPVSENSPGSGVYDFDDDGNWGAGGGGAFPGSDFGGDSIEFLGIAPGVEFVYEINVGVDATNIGGLFNVDESDITFSGGGSFEFDPGAILNTGEGSFTFDIETFFSADVEFRLGDSASPVAGSLLFNESVTFGDGGAGGIATFDAGNATFVGDVTVGANYGFTFDNGVQAAFGDVNFGGDHQFLFEDTDDGKVGAVAVFGGNATFIDAATLTIGGSDASGIATFSGNIDLAGAFSLLVTGGQTVNWTGQTTFGGDFILDTTGAGDAIVTIGGSREFQIASGVEEVNISITTDATDDVSIRGTTFDSGTFNITVEDDSALTLAGGGLSGDEDLAVNFTLDAGSTLTLDSIDPTDPLGPTSPNQWAFNALDGTGELKFNGPAGDFDGELFIRGGEFAGTFSEDATAGALSINWTQNESRFNGTADITGTYRVRNQGLHRIGTFLGDADPGNLRADITNISAFEVLQGTAYLENAQVLTAADGGLTLTSGATSAATLVIENDSTLHALGDFSMDADSIVMITGDSGLGINLEIDGTSAIDGVIDISATSAGTANADFDGEVTLTGSINQSESSFVNFGNALGIQTGAQWSLEGTSTAAVAGDLTVAGLLNLEGTGIDGITVDGATLIQAGGQIQIRDTRTMSLDDDLTLEADGSLLMERGTGMTVDGDLVSAGGISVEANDAAATTLAITGDFSSTGTSLIEAGATVSASSLSLGDGAVMQFADTNLDDAVFSVMNLEEGATVDSGALLFGSGQITLNTAGGVDDFEYAGTVMAGALGDSEGLLEISGGDLVSQAGGVLKFGVNGDVVVDVANGIGQSSIIKVNGDVDFTASGILEVDVQQGAYIPTDLSFTLLEADNFVNADDIDLAAGTESVTRTWSYGVEDDVLDRVYAQSAADYTNTLDDSQIAIGNLLNSFIPSANGDPNNVYGILLGQLDSIGTASAYQAAILGLEPTAQISAIQTVALSQYHDVLRNEIRRRFTLVERRTPAPFRLSNSYEIAGQDQVVERSIRRQVRADPKAESFGAFWSRDLKTPAIGDDVVGFNGNEYGGLGGFGWRLSDNWTAGVDLGYSTFVGDLMGGYGDTRVGTLRGGGFVTWGRGDGLFVDAALSLGWNHFDFTRNVPSTNLSNNSNADGYQIDGTFGIGYRMGLAEGLALTPTGSFLYSYIESGDIDEGGSGPTNAAALSIQSGNLSSYIGRVGADLSWSALPGMVIEGSLGWQGNFTDNGDYNVGLVGQSAAVPVSVDNQTINTGYYGIGVNWNVLEQIDLNLSWEGRSGDGLNSQMLVGGVTISF